MLKKSGSVRAVLGNKRPGNVLGSFKGFLERLTASWTRLERLWKQPEHLQNHVIQLENNRFEYQNGYMCAR